MSPPERRSRARDTPGPNVEKLTTTDPLTLPLSLERRCLRNARRAWVERTLARWPDVDVTHDYGSPEWLDLPDRDPHRFLAVVIAAERWADDMDRLPQRLADEIDAGRRVEELLAAEEFAVMAGKVRRLANSPTFAELQRRREASG